MPDQKEAQSLWAEIEALEASKPGAEEDAESFFMNKGKEMKKLQTAYNKATGVDGSNGAVAGAIQQEQTVRAILGEKPKALTRDDLNK